MIRSGSRSSRFRGARVLGLVGALMLVAAAASAQTSTGTVRGTVSGENGAPVADAQIVARNTASGAQRATVSRDDGSYILPGMVPGTYEMSIRRIGATPQTRTIAVQIGSTHIHNFSLATQAQQLQSVVVVGAPAAIE